jgi:hypothetical protein
MRTPYFHFILNLSWHIRPIQLLTLLVLLSFLLAEPAFARKEKEKRRKKQDTPAATAPAETTAPMAAPALPAGPPGKVEVDVANVAGVNLPAQVKLLPLEDGPPVVLEAPKGQSEGEAPGGKYRAYVYVFQEDVPVLVDVQDIVVSQSRPAYVMVTLLEGASGKLTLRDFDFDGDLAIDSVELKCGTDREKAASVPGKPLIPWESPVLQNEMRWYRGELVSHSKYGGGSESVEDLIGRAERLGLDFLAITDRNTLQSIYDAGYKSDKLVLIPAMEWGTPEKGFAYIYGLKTAPDPPSTMGAAQAECIRVQAQGGVFAVAHPCLASEPWLWGLSYVNAINVWHGGWKSGAPLRLNQLSEDIKVRDKGLLIHSIAAAAARSDLEESSANEESALFWDYEMTRGLMACAIGGSGSKGPKEPLAQPVTYVKAKTKSLAGILEGLRLGYTYISKGLDGPQLYFQGDALNDGKVDVSIGGIVPTGVETMFHVGVKGAKGKKLQVIQDGHALLSRTIESDAFLTRFPLTPNSFSAFRMRVVEVGTGAVNGGLDAPEVLAMSSPIYSQNITAELLQRADIDVDKLWVKVESPKGEVTGPTPKLMDEVEKQ